MTTILKSTFLRALLTLPFAVSLAASGAHAQTMIALSAEDREQIDMILEEARQEVDDIHGADLSPYYSPNMSSYLANEIFSSIRFPDEDNRLTFANVTQVPLDDAGNAGTQVKFTLEESISNDFEDYSATHSAYFVFEKIDGDWYLLDTDYHQYLDGTSDTGSARTVLSDEAATGLGIGLLVFVLLIAVIGILASIFLVWMLVAAATQPDLHLRAVWILLIVFTGILGAIIFYFLEHRAYRKALKQAGVAAPAPVAPPTVPTPPSA